MSENRKKVVAFSAGSRGGNTEIFIKVALAEISKMGIDCEFIRLHECDLRPCKACARCGCFMEGPTGCIIKDDGAWLAEKFMDSDGYIMGAPVWSLSPPGVVTDFRDRVLGPKMDLAVWELGGTPQWAKGRKKHRPGGLISVGGAQTEHWTSMGLSTLYTTTFSAQTDVVDHINVYQVAEKGEALIRRDYLLRAKYLGQNVGHAVLNPEVNWTHNYLGPDEGEACPGCHLSMVIAKPGRNYVECQVCGRKGYISLDENGYIKYDWPDDKQDRLTMMGKYDHMREISSHGEEASPLMCEPEVQEELKRFRAMEEWTIKAPSKSK